MPLISLIYASRATSSISADELDTLTRSAAERNAFRDISGALLYCDGYFMQMLEGADWVVQEVFEKIQKDPRHRDVQKLSCRPITDRTFGAWSMSCLHTQASATADPRKIRYILDHLIDTVVPSHLGEAAEQLLKDMRGAIATYSRAAGIRNAA